MKTERRKYAGLDIAKFACALVILFYHFFSEHGPIPSLFEDVLSLYAVCVALFMVISGFLLYDKLLFVDNTNQRWNIVKKQVVRILKIYLIWSVPYIAFSITQWNFSSITPGYVLWKIRGWIFGSTFYTIWFMPSLAIGMLISFFAIEKMPKALVAGLSVFAYTIGSLSSTYSFLVKSYSWYEPVNSIIVNWLNGSRGQFLFGFPLVTLGYAVAYFKEKYKPFPMASLSIAAMGGLLAEALILRRIAGHTGIDLCILMVPATFCITAFLISTPIPTFSSAEWMRKMSTLIFMSQRIFLTVIPCLFDTINELYKTQYIAFAAVCGGTFLFSAIVILLSKKWNALRLLY